jgi:ankyrin repeat protein
MMWGYLMSRDMISHDVVLQDGWTALHWAAARGHTDCCIFLLSEAHTGLTDIEDEVDYYSCNQHHNTD